VTTFGGCAILVFIQAQCPLSLAIPSWLGAMSSGDAAGKETESSV